MDFFKHCSRFVSSFKKKTSPFNKKRSLRVESLENRELLAVSILSAPVEAYAASSNEAEIQFDLTAQGVGYSRFDFVVQSGGELDPSQLRLVDRATGNVISLSDLSNGTTISSGSAYLGAGTYSLFVGSDSGQGSFTLDILREEAPANTNPALPILVEAALAENEDGWTTRKSHYNKILSYYPGFGAKTFNGGRVIDQFPEVDVNQDGTVDGNDYQIALQLVAGNVVAPELVRTPMVVPQDQSGPTMTATLKNDTGAAGDGVTVDTTIVGRVTDSSGVRSAQYRLDNGSWVALSLDSAGNYTIPHQQVALGTHTVTIQATDTFGNSSTTTVRFTVPESGISDLPARITVGSNQTTALPDGLRVVTLNGSSLSAGNSLSLSDQRGTIGYASNGSLTFEAGSYYNRLGQGETETLQLSLVLEDGHGQRATTTLVFTITGVNDLPVLTDSSARPSTTIEEGKSGTIAASTILKNWSDPDQGTVLNITGLEIRSVSCSNAALAQSLTAKNLAPYLTVNASGVQLDTSADLFQTLGLDETLVLTVAYRVSDGIATSTDTGLLTLTVLGQDDAPILAAKSTTFTVSSNNLNTPRQAITPEFTVSDRDQKDAQGPFVYSVKSCSDPTAGLIVDFNSGNGNFSIDTARLADRDKAATLRIVVAVTSPGGGSTECTITVNLLPFAEPSAGKVVLETTETAPKTCTVVPKVAGNGSRTQNLTLVSGSLPTGTSLNDIATLDANGNFQFNPSSRFAYLAAGEKITLTFRYTIVDTQYGLTGVGEIALTIVGTATDAVPPSSGTIGQNGKYAATENGGNAQKITVSKNDLLAGWTLPESQGKYAVVPGTIRFQAWSDGADNPLSSADFGALSLDAQGNLVLAPTTGLYAALGQGQWIELAVDYSIQNLDGTNAVSGGTVLFRVLGANDAPTIRAETGTFNIASNTAQAVELDPKWTVRDVDRNDTSFSYGLDDTSSAMGFRIDSTTGKITIDNTALGKLSGNQELTVTVRDEHGGKATAAVSIFVYKESAPAVDQVRFQVAENGRNSTDLNAAVLKKEGHVYSIGSLRCTDATGVALPDGWNPMDYVRLENGILTIVAETGFEFLAEGEQLILSFEYTVRDDGFTQCESTGTVRITVGGRNNAPVFDSTGAQNPLAVKASVSNTLDWNRFFSDPDRSDRLTITKIDGMEFVDGTVRVEGVGVFQYANNVLTFTPSSDFDSLGENLSAAFLSRVVLTVADENGATVEGTILLDIAGTNKAPSVKDLNTLIDETGKVVLSLEQLKREGYITDINAADEHVFVSVIVQGQRLDAQNASVFLADGTTVSLDITAGTLTVDTATRKQYPEDGMPETIVLTVRVSDQALLNPLSNEATWNVLLEPVAPEVRPVELPSVTESETAPLDPVRLDDFIVDKNYPERTRSGDWYDILGFDLVSASVDGKDLENAEWERFRSFWTYENGTLLFEAPEGYFDFLAEGEELLLVFGYAVRDNLLCDTSGNLLSSEGTIRLSILGENDDPVLALQGSWTDAICNSGSPAGTLFELGRFDFSDPDRRENDSISWSAENIVSTGPTLGPDAILVAEDGTVWLAQSGLPQPAPGASATITFDVVLDDGRGGKDRRNVSVTIYGKKEPIILVGDLTTTESEDDMTVSGKIDVTDPDEPFMDDRSGNDWYGRPEIVSVTAEGYEDEFSDEELFAFFEILGDDTTGYSMRFIGTKERFAFLNANETLVFSVQISVRDLQFDVENTARLTCSVIGTGDVHSVELPEGDASVEFLCNERDVTQTVHEPRYEIFEQDRGEGHYFELGEIQGNPPDGFDQDLHLHVNPETGAITIDHAGFAALTDKLTFQVTVNVIGRTDGLSVPVILEVTTDKASAPVVGDLLPGAIGETGTITEELDINVPEDGAQRDPDHWYVISDPELGSFEGPLPEGESLPPTGYTVKIEDGIFVFEANGVFDYLALGESMTLHFRCSVSDARYDAESVLSITVVVNGENAAPYLKKDLAFGGEDSPIVYGDSEVVLGRLSDMIDDKDLSDRHDFLYVDGIGMALGEWVSVAGKGQFLFDGEYVRYKALSAEGDGVDLLEAIRHGETEAFTFNIVFRDRSGAENNFGSGSFRILVQGANSAPVLNTGEDKIAFELLEHSIKRYTADELARDVNKGDSLSFHSFNKTVISDDNREFRLADGTTVRFLGDAFDTVEFDTTTRYADKNLAKDELGYCAISFAVRDDSGAENDKTGNMSYQLVIRGVNDAPVMNDQTFGFAVGENDFLKARTINLSDTDTPRNQYRFSGGEDIRFLAEESSAGLEDIKNPHVMLDAESGEIAFWKLPTLPEGQYAVFQFTVTATNQDDPTETVTAVITVKLANKKAPAYELSEESLVVNESDPTGKSLFVSVTDPENADREGRWYDFVNARFVEGTINGGAREIPLTSLPEGALFGFEPGGDAFYFQADGAFDFLGRDETARLVFEFAVRDLEYGVDTTVELVVLVQGKNTAPEALNHVSPWDYFADGDDDIRFYLSDLAADRDTRDTLHFASVNGSSALGEAIEIKDGNTVLGTVQVFVDLEKQEEYLFFLPSAGCEAIPHEVIKRIAFTFTVTDGLEESKAAEISFNMRGTNKTPVFKGDTLRTDEKTVLEIRAEDLVSDVNEGDTHRIVEVQAYDKDNVLRKIVPASLDGDHTIQLLSGATLTVRQDGTLLYDPTTRGDNLALGASELLNELSVRIADDSGAVDAETGLESIGILVRGVNDAPKDLQPENTAITGRFGEELMIKLDEHFTDLDDDSLEFFLSETAKEYPYLDDLFIRDGYLVLKFISLDRYESDFDFAPRELTLKVSDGRETVAKTFTVSIPQGTTASLRAVVSDDRTQAYAGERYEVEIWARDLLNTLLDQDTGLGLDRVSFVIYYEPGLSAIDYETPEGVVVQQDSTNRRISVSVDRLTLDELGADADRMLFKFGVTATDTTGTAEFKIGNITMTRNDQDETIDISQIEVTEVRMEHCGVREDLSEAQVVFFTTSSVDAAFAALPEALGWTGEQEMLYGSNNNEASRLDLAFEDPTLLEDDFSFAEIIPTDEIEFDFDDIIKGPSVLS